MGAFFGPFSAYSQRNHAFYSCNKKHFHTFQEYMLTINHVQNTCCLVSKSDLALLRTPGTVCSLPGSSVHGISQARILEWSAIFFSRWSSQPRDWTRLFCIARQILYHWPPGESLQTNMGNKYMVLKNWSFHNPVMVKDNVQVKYNLICQVITVVMKKKTQLGRKESSRRYFHVLSVQLRLANKVIIEQITQARERRIEYHTKRNMCLVREWPLQRT